MGCWQLLQMKQCSCQVCPLYSSFREPVGRGREGGWVSTPKPRGCRVRGSGHHQPTWHDHLLAGHTLGGELPAIAAVAEELLSLAGEGLVGQGAVAAEAAETALVVMAVLVVQLLWGREAEVRGQLPTASGHLGRMLPFLPGDGPSIPCRWPQKQQPKPIGCHLQLTQAHYAQPKAEETLSWLRRLIRPCRPTPPDRRQIPVSGKGREERMLAPEADCNTPTFTLPPHLKHHHRSQPIIHTRHLFH